MEKQRVLFIGNSITRHAPAPDIGWHGDWGMAASCEEKDYVHVMMRSFEKAGIPAEYHVKNIAGWERSFWERDLEELREQREFDATIIILRVTENVDEKEAAARVFGSYYNELIRFLDPERKALVVCSNGFGEHPVVNHQIEAVARMHGYPLADLSALWFNDENKALDKFEHEGVRAHPSDTGMETIANILFSHVMREMGKRA